MFALVRTKTNAQKLIELGAKNLHILEADITDVKALKVILNSLFSCSKLIVFIQIAAAEVKKVTGGSLDYLVNNAAFVEDTRRDNNLDG